MATKKGRPKQNNNDSVIDDVNLEYLSTKTDKFDNSIAYSKLIDPTSKWRPAIHTQATDNDMKLPTDTQDVILKVKGTWLQICDNLQPSRYYILNVDFSAYLLDTENGTLRVYYAKVITTKKKKWNQ